MYGVKIDTLTVNLAAVIQRKQTVVQSMRDMNLHNLKTALLHNLIIGTGQFVAPKTIEVTTAEGKTSHLTAERFFINTGTRPIRLS
jgi:pyruvate/2-oxoglutarate dehydrogenase complex dihydrolipoamide dehydrogenase (E3) component